MVVVPLEVAAGVHAQLHAGDVAGLVGGQEQHGVADVDRLDVRDRHGLLHRERQLGVLPGSGSPGRAGTTADIPVELIRRVISELPFSSIFTGYGLTEAGTVSLSRSGDSFEDIATTVGTPCEGYEVRIADDGEVLVRGFCVLKGYLNDLAATAEAVDEEGWLHTGDLGSLDDRGRLRIAGRKKDMFIVGGFNAYPAEIEGFLLEHPAVGQVAVTGVPDERLGQVGKAFVVRSGPVTAEELIAWSRERMAGFKVPRYVEFLAELPLNATGKVMKDQLR